MALLFCSFAVETIFPLSNFITKHIFEILMARVKFLKPFGFLKSDLRIPFGILKFLKPQFFFIATEDGASRRPGQGAPNFCFYTFTATEGGAQKYEFEYKYLSLQIFLFVGKCTI